MYSIDKLPSRRQSLITIIASLLWMMTQTSFAADEIYTGRFSNTAAGGYDVVSFFNAEQPTKGQKKFSVNYKGTSWQFASEENKLAFESEPERYAPQYGGYCAYAVALNEVAKGSPRYWDIHDGKLYFSLNKKYQRIWQNDKENLITMADMFWPDLISQ